MYMLPRQHSLISPTNPYRDDKTIKLNFEDVSALDEEIAKGYSVWVANAPQKWKTDGFLENNSPIVVTSRYGQNAAIAVLGKEDEEADIWDWERDFSKTAFLTFALATSIE
jgi:hypothetical protein